LPETADEFMILLKYFFPTIYDLKYIIKDERILRDAGLNKLALEI